MTIRTNKKDFMAAMEQLEKMQNVFAISVEKPAGGRTLVMDSETGTPVFFSAENAALEFAAAIRTETKIEVFEVPARILEGQN